MPENEGPWRHVGTAARACFAIAAATALVLAIATTAWAVYKGYRYIRDLVDAPSRDAPLVILFEVVDVLLIATLLYVFALGLFTLFVRDLELPAWLEVEDLEHLELRLASTLVLVLAVRFLEALVAPTARTDLLETAAAIGVVGVLLLAFVVVTRGLNRNVP